MRPRIKKRKEAYQSNKNNNFWTNTFKKDAGNFLKQEKIKNMTKQNLTLEIFTGKGSVKCSSITISKGIRFVWVGWNNNINKNNHQKPLKTIYRYF